MDCHTAAHPRAMSIYKSRFERRYDENDVTVTRTVTDWAVPRAPSRIQAPRTDTKDWSRSRKARPMDQLLPTSTKWIESLPVEQRPTALIAQFPRIVNLLALEWRKPAACRAYFDELLIDHRGNRKGFPPDVHEDLQKLRVYYAILTRENAAP